MILRLLFLVFIFLANLLALRLPIYETYPPLDAIFHFLGGFGIALLFDFYFTKEFSRLPALKHAFLLVSAAVFIGVLWEFAEYIANFAIGPNFSNISFIGNLDDTLNDLLMDTLGAILVAVLSLHSLRHRKPQKKQRTS